MFAIMLPVEDDEESLRNAEATIDSLRRQAYPNWRLLIVPQNGKSGVIRARLLGGGDALSDQAELLRCSPARRGMRSSSR